MSHQRRKDKRPAEICAAALDVFGEIGYGAAGMSKIAERAGISRPTLYLYYANKQAIFEALIKQSLAPVVANAKAVGDDFQGPTAQLLTTTLQMMITQIARPDVSRILHLIIAEGHQFPDLAVFYKAHLVDPGRALLHQILQRGVKSGEFRPEIADLDVRLLLSPGLLSVVWTSLFNSVEPMDTNTLLQGYIDMLLNGVLKP